MRTNISTISGGGDGRDAYSQPQSLPNVSKNEINSQENKLSNSNPSSGKEDEFTLNYGNYGDPYSFIPYQLILLLADFVFNWTMDLVHDYPLAVLVIFVLQSLALIVNLILYIMASASQAMQLGVQRRVTIHHWINLFVCLTYMTLTGWWFIWALRKSWPSVSDQFSFTWRSEYNSTLGPVVPTASSTNSTGRPPNYQEVKEHHTLWSPGFNTVYIIHRTIAIIYYFVYFRATFLVLNSQKIDKFLEMKTELVRRLKAKRTYEKEKKVRKNNGKLRSFPAASGMQLGLDEYLGGNLALENENRFGEGKKQRKTKKQMSVLWADNDNNEERKESPHRSVDDKEPPQRELMKVKERRKQWMEDDEENMSSRGGGDEPLAYAGRDVVRSLKESDDDEPPPKPKPRPRSSRQDRNTKRRGSESNRKDLGNDYDDNA